MKIIKKIFIWVLAVFAVIFIIAAIIIALYGKKIVESQIERNLKRATVDRRMDKLILMNKEDVGANCTSIPELAKGKMNRARAACVKAGKLFLLL